MVQIKVWFLCYSQSIFDVLNQGVVSMLQSECLRGYDQSVFDVMIRVSSRIKFHQFIIDGWLGVALSNPLVNCAS